MSVRRLAEPQFQPQTFTFNEEFAASAQKWIAKYPEGRQQSAIIPLLMLAQEQNGWVTKAAIESICDMLGMPYIRGLEVATFYTQFQLKPVGTHAHIQVCGTTPCMLRGAGELMDVCRAKIHPEPLQLNEEGTLSWEEVECQGACVNAPMIMIFKDTYEDLTPERLAEIIDAFEAGKGETVPPGPQIERHFSAPAGGFTALGDEAAVLKGTSTGVKASASTKEKASAKAPASVKTKTPSKAAPIKAKAEKPALDDKNRPAGIARPDVVDDLKLISGIGPKNEGLLHELGIFTFAQIAAWKKAERTWVDGYLSFHGRIEREDWVKQAKALAKGGVEEYIRVFGKKPV
ncbi:NADH-quinone oxidoreductase subunit NuoE [Aquamicrobium segne]|uniref:NADH-quinone oxidoreductase subunit NuoE n=1 Tax=Aquamicrobium segne TaxID=469547 RepID=A0ABW0GXK6_9HYPH